jgi:hypothetical protein
MVLLLACGSMAAQSLSAVSPGRIPVQQNLTERAERRLQRNKKLWLVSIPLFLAASVLDAQSSWGKTELNPLLRGQAGRFDGRSAAIKIGITGGILGSEYSVIHMFRHNRESQNGAYAASAWSNFIGAGALAAVAVHNYHTPKADSSGTLK